MLFEPREGVLLKDGNFGRIAGVKIDIDKDFSARIFGGGNIETLIIIIKGSNFENRVIADIRLIFDDGLTVGDSLKNTGFFRVIFVPVGVMRFKCKIEIIFKTGLKFNGGLMSSKIRMFNEDLISAGLEAVFAILEKSLIDGDTSGAGRDKNFKFGSLIEIN